MAHNLTIQFDNNKLDELDANTAYVLRSSGVQSNQLVSTFSIATPTITSNLPLNESISDTSFMQPVIPNQSGTYFLENTPLEDDSTAMSQVQNVNNAESGLSQDNLGRDSNHGGKQDLPVENCFVEGRIDNNSNDTQTGQIKGAKKKIKSTKKNTKLDAKSKLEKSRQSARECRARKKLRYQYLEDLVCNREKAVTKLREELSMFCELSKQIDNGSIKESDKRFLIDQSKENNKEGPGM